MKKKHCGNYETEDLSLNQSFYVVGCESSKEGCAPIQQTESDGNTFARKVATVCFSVIEIQVWIFFKQDLQLFEILLNFFTKANMKLIGVTGQRKLCVWYPKGGASCFVFSGFLDNKNAA